MSGVSGGSPGIATARITVDAGKPQGTLLRLWTTFGYDELNWSHTPRGKRALAAFGAFAETPYYVRAHNLLTSGRGFSWPHWGSGNVYHEDAAGNPYYDWTTVDLVFDAYLGAGLKPLVELGFTPLALVPPGAELPFTRSPSQYGPYEAGLWSFPPRDNARWQELMFQLAQHCVARYGADEVASWYWELWNEPDISYWRGTVQQFCALYDHTVAGLTRALPSIKVGGPAVTGSPRALPFMDAFLGHCAGEGDYPTNVVTGERGARLDFITFHTKGSAFPRRYDPLSDDGARLSWGGDTQGNASGNGQEDGRVDGPRQSPSRKKMLSEIRAHLQVAARYPRFRDLPCIVDECDPCVPAHFSRYDNANFGFRNTAYYPAIMASVFKRLMDLNDSLPNSPDVTLASAWAFYFEGERFFEGFREFVTAENVELPLLNGYRLLARLGATRLTLASDATWDIQRLDELPAPDSPATSIGTAGVLPDAEVDGLATLGAPPTSTNPAAAGSDTSEASEASQNRVSVLVWHHLDDQYAAAPPAQVTVEVINLPFAAQRAQVRHWRIDESHSNAYSVWQAMGRPQDPTAEQLDQLKARQGVEQGAPIIPQILSNNALRLELTLPLHALSLMEVTTNELTERVSQTSTPGQKIEHVIQPGRPNR